MNAISLSKRTNTRCWYGLCLGGSLFILSIPFLWRTEFSAIIMIGGCLAPFILAASLIALIFWFRAHPINAWHYPVGPVLIAVSYCIAVRSDSFAQRQIFSWNYPLYRSFVQTTLKSQPKSKGPVMLSDASGLGVDHAVYSTENGRPIVEILTISGPALVATDFSPKPIFKLAYGGNPRLILKDDLGYWYFNER